MKPSLKLLEDRVHRVVEQLRAVTTERDHLRTEVGTAAPSPGTVPEEWVHSLDEVERVLGEAAQELRGD